MVAAGVMAALTKFLSNPKMLKNFATGMVAGSDVAKNAMELSGFTKSFKDLMEIFSIVAVPMEILTASLSDEATESAVKLMNLFMEQLQDPTVKLVFDTMGKMFFDMINSTTEFVSANFELGRFLEGLGKVTKTVYDTVNAVERLGAVLQWFEDRANAVADIFEVPTTDTSGVQYTDPNQEEGQTEEEYAEDAYQDFVGF